MKSAVKNFLLFSTALWLLLGLFPLFAAHRLPKSPPAQAEEVDPTPDDTFRILDVSDGTVLTVPEDRFLPCALLCEMSPDAPEEALKAQAVAIYTTCCRMRQQNRNEASDFTCDTAAYRLYAPPEVLEKKYGADWESRYAYTQSLCDEIAGQQLWYDGALISAPYFPLSNGCTQSYTDVWGGETLPYLQAVACPVDRLHSELISVARYTPDEITGAFPTVTFSEDPANWFSDLQNYSSNYVNQINICGTVFTGTQVREALSLRSAAFTSAYDGSQFLFTVYGSGHGVGMSQSAAVYMAEHGASYTQILSYFYPDTELRNTRLHPSADSGILQAEQITDRS